MTSFSQSNEENPQSMTKITKFDPFHVVKIAPKLDKSTDHDSNLISSQGGQEESACKL